MDLSESIAADRILSAPMIPLPYHHIVVDDVLSDELLARMNEQWPGDFDPEYIGKGICTLFQPSFDRMEHADFWKEIGKVVSPALAHAAMKRFATTLLHVHEDLNDFPDWGALPTLMHSNTDFDGQNIHTHFTHNPNWTLTFLLYLGGEGEGTALWQPRGDWEDLDWLAYLAMDTLRWDHRKDLELVRLVPFRANRLLVFLDGPLALHSVPPGTVQTAATRRILRIHMSIKLEKYLEHRVPFVENHRAYRRMMLPPYAEKPDLIAELTGADIKRRESEGRDFVVREILSRRNAPTDAGYVPSLPDYDVELSDVARGTGVHAPLLATS